MQTYALASPGTGPDQLSLTFAALADPTRRAILERLSQGDLSVSEVAAPFQMSLPAVSKHLRVLERARLISRRRDAQQRPCHLTAEPLSEVMEFARAYERFWSRKLDALSDYLAVLQKQKQQKEPSVMESPDGLATTLGPSKVERSPAERPRKTRKKGTHGTAKPTK